MQTRLKPQKTPNPGPGKYSRQDYEKALSRARGYFATLEKRACAPSTLEQLLFEFKQHRHNSTQDSSLFDTKEIESWSLLTQYREEKKLKRYLRNSISYIYLRDLGKDISDTHTSKEINTVVSKIVRQLRQISASDNLNHLESSIDKLAKKHGASSAYHWLQLKLAHARSLFARHKNEHEGMRKLVKVIAGVVMHQLTAKPDSTPGEIDTSIRLGYCYGLTYPFVDDLLDSSEFLSETDKMVFTQTLRRCLQTGAVQPFPEFKKTSIQMRAIYDELSWAFTLIKTLLKPTQAQQFFYQAYIFFEAQTEDRERRLSAASPLSTEQLFLPVVIKSAGCRLISRDLVASQADKDFDTRTFCFGIYNQFNDDIKDIFEDIAEDSVTPYTYFLNQGSDEDAIQPGPYRVYWAVVHYLVFSVYKNHPETKALLLERSLNAHRALKQKVGETHYAFLKERILHTANPAFDILIDNLVNLEASTWFDKILSTEIRNTLAQSSQRQTAFEQTYNSIKTKVNTHLTIQPLARLPDGAFCDIANYAVGTNGKRLRPVIAQYMGNKLYRFRDKQCVEMNAMLEFMHTSSLIIDDLPSQDNADLRRGNPTIHVRYNSEATAELSAVYLMMKAVELQSSIQSHPAERVLKSLAYAANTTQLICEGQLQDLHNPMAPVTQKQLEDMYWLKTGLAIEAAFVIPALLAGQDDIHISALKRLARHLGIAFQIKDDLLDLPGMGSNIGKPQAQDESKHSMVNVLGEQAAIDLLFEHYQAAKHLISQHLNDCSEFLLPLVDFVVLRTK